MRSNIKTFELKIGFWVIILISLGVVPFFPNPVSGLVYPQSYPADPTLDIPWSSGTTGVADIQAAFNNARSMENSQLGISIPSLILPDQSTWDAMSENDKVVWLVNRERIDRGVHPMDGWEPNVVGVAQGYAQYLLDNDTTGHFADGKDPWTRLNENPAINACHDFLSVAENLAYFWTSGSSIPLSLERAVYMWMYTDSTSSWGHRHMLLWYPYNENGGENGVEGFMGLGYASGPHQNWNLGHIYVLNVFDPCADWQYPEYIYIPLVIR